MIKIAKLTGENENVNNINNFSENLFCTTLLKWVTYQSFISSCYILKFYNNTVWIIC